MTKEIDNLVKSLKSFVQLNQSSTVYPMVGTIYNFTDDLQYCDVSFDQGDLSDIPTFGIPKVGTAVIVLFIGGSYANPIAICNPINVLDEEKIETYKSRGANNCANNGDFVNGSEGYTGSFKIDSSIADGKIDLICTYIDENNKTYSIQNYTGTDSSKEYIEEQKSTWNNGWNITLTCEIGEEHTEIPIKLAVTDNEGNPVSITPFYFNIFGETIKHYTMKDGQINFNYNPPLPFTNDGYFAVLPKENDYIEFDCSISELTQDYFKVQCYYQSTTSVLRLSVVDTDTKAVIKNVPESIGQEYNDWRINTDKWLVNRERYAKKERETGEIHENITVRFTNVGENPIRIDGIMVNYESADYDYYKSREDLING